MKKHKKKYLVALVVMLLSAGTVGARAVFANGDVIWGGESNTQSISDSLDKLSLNIKQKKDSISSLNSSLETVKRDLETSNGSVQTYKNSVSGYESQLSNLKAQLASKDNELGFNLYLGGKVGVQARPLNLFISPSQVKLTFKTIVDLFKNIQYIATL